MTVQSALNHRYLQSYLSMKKVDIAEILGKKIRLGKLSKEEIKNEMCGQVVIAIC